MVAVHRGTFCASLFHEPPRITRWADALTDIPRPLDFIPPVDSRYLPWAKVTLSSIRLRAQSVVFPRPGRCARRVAVSRLLRTLRLAPLPRSAHDPLPELGTAEAPVEVLVRGHDAAAARRARPARRCSTSRPGSRGGRTRNRPTPPRETSQYSLPPKHPCTTPRHSPACRTSPKDLLSSWPRGVSRPCRSRTASPAILKHPSRCSARTRSHCSRRTRRFREGSARCSRPRFSEGRRKSRSSSPRGRRTPTGPPTEAREKGRPFQA